MPERKNEMEFTEQQVYEAMGMSAPEEPTQPAAPADKPDAEVPSDRTAQTGDDMKIAAIVTLMLAAAAGIAVCARRLYLNK